MNTPMKEVNYSFWNNTIISNIVHGLVKTEQSVDGLLFKLNNKTKDNKK